MVAQERRPLRVEGHGREGVQRLLHRRRLTPRQGQVDALHHGEVEHQVELVAVLVAEELALLLGREVDLAEQDGVALTALEERAQVLQVAVRVDGRGVGDAVELEQERDGVDPESADPELQPEPDDPGDLLPHVGVGDVQVGLVGHEPVEVVLLGLAVVGPHPALLAGEDLGELGVLGPLVHPHVPVAVRRGGVRPSRLEPRVLDGRVVDDQVDDHPHAPVAGGADHLDELAQRAQSRVDAVEVGDVVAVVAVGRRVERHQPQRRDADARPGSRCARPGRPRSPTPSPSLSRNVSASRQ